jgi:hypothetical protein
MELRKVKLVLILLFAALNVLLLVLMLNSVPTGEISPQILKNAKAALAVNGVTLKCEIPAYNPDTGIPEYADTSYDANAMGELLKQSGGNGLITFNEDNSVVIYNIADAKISKIIFVKELQKYITNLLARLKINMEGFVPDSTSTYILKLSKNLYAYDCTAEMVISEAGIEYLKIKHRELIRTYDVSPIIPAYQILMRNYNKGGTVIDSIDLGFIAYKLTGDAQNLSYTPAWRVISAGRTEVKYFRAYTGDEIINY